jgi:thymidine kinase
MPEIYKPGHLQVIFGPMKSGKSKYLIRVFDELFYSDIESVIFKPAVDTRETGIASRASTKQLEAIVVNEKTPQKILSFVESLNSKIIGIDEAQFFSLDLVEVVAELIRKNYHIIVCGLLLSFRGEPFYF